MKFDDLCNDVVMAGLWEDAMGSGPFDCLGLNAGPSLRGRLAVGLTVDV